MFSQEAMAGRYGLPGGVFPFGRVNVFSGAEGKELLRFYGRLSGDFMGWSVSTAGDVDGDGAADYIVGASGANTKAGIDAGSVYVLSSHINMDTSTLPNGEAGVTYYGFLNPNGGNPPYRMDIVSGSLPLGLSLYDDGTIYGIPTKAKIYNFTVKLKDQSRCTVYKDYSIKIFQSIRITTRHLPDGQVGKTYFAALNTKGGRKPHSWSLVSGHLPAGLTLKRSKGEITGTPKREGAFDPTFQVIDHFGGKDQQLINIRIINQ